jgi:hypothetical protein
VLNLDGLTAVTDRDGDFEFPVVKANAYRLSMDRANLAVDKVPVENLPRDVTVIARERQDLQIALVRTATLVATVITARANAPSAGAQNVLVTLQHGDAVYRRLTDANGRIELGGLPPGEWHVTLASDTLPTGYALPDGARRLELTPGAAATVEFTLTPIARDMRMQPPLEVH